MKTSLAGVRFIESQEGFVPTVYLDIAGIPTIGFGHVIRHGDPQNVTRAQAEVILSHDLASAESAVNNDVKVPLTQNAFDALCSFTFNLGTGALAASGLLQLLNRGLYHAAADEFLKWCHARVGGKLVEVEGLKKRRIAERATFLSGLDLPTTTPVSINDAPPVLSDPGQPTPPEDLPDA